jgi:hypothetical protein
VFDPCHLSERTVEKDRIAVLVLDIAYDAIDPVGIRMKVIEAQLVAVDKIDHDTNAHAYGQPEDMDKRVPPLSKDVAPGYFR